MTKPVTIPNTFATATTAIPLSQLDSDFSTVATALNDANTYSNYAADTGVANAYVVTLTGVSTTYSAGLRIQFKAGASNTGASTLNVNGGGTKNITFQDASALSSGTIAANAIVDVMYDGTQFLLMNDPAGTVGTGDVVGPAGATANAVVRFDSTTGKLVKNSVVTIADSTGDVAGVGALTATGNVSFDGGTFVFNESGADKDFRIEGDTDANLFFTDASTDRVGIGTSSPATKLEAVGVIRASSGTGQLNIGITGGIPYIQGYDSATAGNRQLAFYTNAEVMRLDSSGNLGLGVTPSAWGVVKAIQLQAGGDGGGVLYSSSNVALGCNHYFDGTNWRYISNGYATAYYQQYGGLGATTSHTWLTAPSGFGYGTAATSLTSTQNGNSYTIVSAGTTDFTLIGAANNNVGTTFTKSGGTGTGTGTVSQPITFTQAMTLDASGNLVVGYTSASYRLDVWGSTSIVGQIRNNTVGTGVLAQLQFSTSNNYDGFSKAAVGAICENANTRATALGFYSEGSDGTLGERARITSGGDLLVGKTSYGGTATGVDLGQNGFVGSYSPDTTNSTTTFAAYSNGASAYRFYVGWGGTVYATSTTITAISDQRLKENIQDIDVGLSAVMALKPRKFDWKAGKGKDKKGDRGWIAQEFEQVFPDMIDTWKDEPPEGEEPYKAVNADLIPVLVKAIQEQQALITSLTARVALLEGN